jgi:hypothetical protein
MTYWTRISGLLLGLLAIGATFGPGERARPALAQTAQLTFVGTVEGTDAFIGIVTDGDRLIAYLCDGAGASLADFYTGAAHDAAAGMLTLKTDDGPDVLTLATDDVSQPRLAGFGTSLAGSFVMADGVSHAFIAELAAGPGALYRTDETMPDGTDAEGGWVVLSNGDVRGSLNKTQPDGAAPSAAQMSAAATGTSAQASSQAPPGCEVMTTTFTIPTPTGDATLSDYQWVVAGSITNGGEDYLLCQSQPVLAQSAPNDLLTQMQTASSATPLAVPVKSANGKSAPARVMPAQVCVNPSPQNPHPTNPPSCHA